MSNDADLQAVPLHILYVLALGASDGADANPPLEAERPLEAQAPVDAQLEATPPIAEVTRATVFGGASIAPLADEGALGSAPPPLAQDAAQTFVVDAPEAKPKPFDPAPLWLDRLFEAFGARPNYITREPKVELTSCDASDPRCQQFHDDHARVDATDAPAAITASAMGTAIGLMLGGKDRPLGGGVKLRGKARFVGLVGEW